MPPLWSVEHSLGLYEDLKPVTTLLRELGVRLVAYIHVDDFLIMAKSQQM